LPLHGQRVEVIGVDLRDEERHVGVHAVVAGVRDDRVSLVRERRLHFARHRGVEAGEQDLGLELLVAGLDHAARGRLREGSPEAPRAGVLVRLARRPVRRRQLLDLEPGVIGEELHEALSDRARGAEHAHCHLSHSVILSDGGSRIPAGGVSWSWWTAKRSRRGKTTFSLPTACAAPRAGAGGTWSRTTPTARPISATGTASSTARPSAASNTRRRSS